MSKETNTDLLMMFYAGIILGMSIIGFAEDSHTEIVLLMAIVGFIIGVLAVLYDL